MKAPVLLLAATLLLAGCDRFTSVETRIERATAKLGTGEYQAALIDVRKALDAQPENVAAQLLLVDILAASGDSGAALNQLDLATSAGASPDMTEARRVELLLDLKRIDAAKQALDASKALPPIRRNVLEGRLLLLQQRPEDAERAFNRAWTEDPRLIDAAIGRVEALTAQGKTAQAQEALAQLLTDEPESARGWLLQGQLAAQAGEFDRASEAFATSVKNGKSLKRDELLLAHAQHVESLLAAGQLAEARSALELLAATAGNAPIASYMRAKVLLANHETSAAVNELRKFTQAAPLHVPGRLLLASALLQQGNTEQAYAEAVRNVAEFGQYDEPRLVLANIELSMGRFANAEETLQPLIARSPPNPSAMAMLADLRIRRGEAVAGVSLLEQSVAEQPDNARLRLQLAAAYLSAGEAKRALATLEPIKDAALSPARDRVRVIATAALTGASGAEQELKSALERNPGDVDLLLMAASYYTNHERWDVARSYLERARKLRPEDPMLALALGRLELATGRADEAEKLARTILDKVPDDAAAMALMAGVAAQQGRNDDVDAWLNRARIAKPGALEVSVALARRAVARGANSEARSVLADAVRNAPSDPRARIALAELDASMGRYEDAMRELQTADADKPDSPPILLAMARVQLAAKNLDAARGALTKALTTAPGWLPAATTLVALESSVGNQAAALEVVRELRRTDPQGSASYALEGEIYMAAKRPADAAKVFADAYRRSPGAMLAIRAAQAKSTAKLPGAETELLDWIARAPNDAITRRTLAEYHLAAGRNDVAIKELETVIAARPNDAIALNNLAWLYQLSGNPRALSMAERAYAAAPNAAAVADTYGWILVQGGKPSEGVRILSQAVKLAPDNHQTQYHLAYALSQAGEKRRAIEILRQITSSGKPFESLAQARQLLSALE